MFWHLLFIINVDNFYPHDPPLRIKDSSILSQINHHYIILIYNNTVGVVSISSTPLLKQQETRDVLL